MICEALIIASDCSSYSFKTPHQMLSQLVIKARVEDFDQPGKMLILRRLGAPLRKDVKRWSDALIQDVIG